MVSSLSRVWKMLFYDSIISQSYTMTFVTDTNINITKIKPDSAPENSPSERKKTTASVVAANRICLFLQAEHCPRGICNQHTKQNKSHRAMNQPVQEHLSPISTISFYRLIIHLPPDSQILLLSLIALMGNVQGCFCAFPARSFHSL